MRYLVTVHCCGSDWIVRVPAVDRWSVTTDKRSVPEVARMMIAQVLGVSRECFDLDLTTGRAVGSVDEFATASTRLLRWGCADGVFEKY